MPWRQCRGIEEKGRARGGGTCAEHRCGSRDAQMRMYSKRVTEHPGGRIHHVQRCYNNPYFSVLSSILQNDLCTTRLSEVAEDDATLFSEAVEEANDASNQVGREGRCALLVHVLSRRRTTRPAEVAADEEALFSYQVLSRRRMTRPTEVAADKAARFLVPGAMKTAAPSHTWMHVRTRRSSPTSSTPMTRRQGACHSHCHQAGAAEDGVVDLEGCCRHPLRQDGASMDGDTELARMMLRRLLHQDGAIEDGGMEPEDAAIVPWMMEARSSPR